MSIKVRLENDSYLENAYVGFSWTIFFFGFWVPLFRKKFKDFTLLQIIRMLEINTRKQQRQDTEMQHFPNNIDSFNTSAQIEFYGAIKRLINMRNKLAHELENLNFKNTTHCIEVLSDNILSNELGIQIDEKYDEDGQLRMIASNTVFIRKIEKELNNMYA